jgi:large subunit ribosomal protein L10
VSEITDLRRSLREQDTRLAVVKNTLMQRAATDAGVQELTALLIGPSAIAFVGGDPVAAAKQIKAAAKLYPSLVLKGGFMDGRVLSADEANSLADLESREVMLSKIAGLLKGELSRAASMLVSIQSNFLATLEAYKEKLPQPEQVVEEVQEREVDQAPAEAAASEEEAVAVEDATNDEAATGEE